MPPKKSPFKTVSAQHPMRQRVSFTCTGDSLTEQSHKRECDINFIMAQYRKTGLMPHINRFQGAYQDCDFDNYHEAMNLVIEARDSFLDLPAHLRKSFNNDPQIFLDFVSNPENEDQLIELGLKEKPAVAGGGVPPADPDEPKPKAKAKKTPETPPETPPET